MVIGETSEAKDGEVVTMKNLIDGKVYTVPIKKLYSKRPHITADNHFSGENVIVYGRERFWDDMHLSPRSIPTRIEVLL
jgi:hypothetical protein